MKMKLFPHLVFLDLRLKERAHFNQLPSSQNSLLRYDCLDNPGLATGMLKENPETNTILSGMGIAAYLTDCLMHRKNRKHRFPALMVLYGSISNFAERLLKGSVTDMIHFPTAPGRLKHLRWNLSDFLILTGSVFTLFQHRKNASR